MKLNDNYHVTKDNVVKANPFKRTQRGDLTKLADAYILNAISEDTLEEYGKPYSTEKEKLQSVFDIFKDEYGHEIPRRGIQGALDQWFRGLPGVINIDYMNYEIINIAKKWGSIPQNATESQEDKIIHDWFNFIAAKTLMLMRKKGVNIYA